ncbi:hypothetical protein ASPACDRAFT_1853136 [Aspergillus aculeatus ATCC 16872]|uniref:Uncharacterized protein n=1 Tax=Aspergillus aculeatus (strain ATCC 16872 / CBS 172.66 / WB 5094) TaxID=690307 RepID=A0A1L9X7D2_ASPA1|nr:uncharacterized protein ASPACDRAFT_1853136 [Aspergillus aculeatus ATCC 16872]OJK04228.1 hypothetical protein ASPACDRAFT_1853136 [Aspergillus aculeatus ATCC 16872]
MDLPNEQITANLLSAAIWLLLVLLLMALTFAILGILVGLLCALITTATTLFAYAGTDLWENLESYCERAHRPRLLGLVSLVAKVQTPDSERALQLDYLQKKHALVAEASALVQRHARLAAQIDEAREPQDSVPHSTKDHSMQRNQLMQESHTVSVQLRTNWQKIKALSDEYPVKGAWIRADSRMAKKLEPYGKEAQACRLWGGCWSVVVAGGANGLSLAGVMMVTATPQWIEPAFGCNLGFPMGNLK